MTKGLEYSLQGLIKFVDAGILIIAIAGALWAIAKAFYWFCNAMDIVENGR